MKLVGMQKIFIHGSPVTIRSIKEKDPVKINKIIKKQMKFLQKKKDMGEPISDNLLLQLQKEAKRQGLRDQEKKSKSKFQKTPNNISGRI